MLTPQEQCPEPEQTIISSGLPWPEKKQVKGTEAEPGGKRSKLCTWEVDSASSRHRMPCEEPSTREKAQVAPIQWVCHLPPRGVESLWQTSLNAVWATALNCQDAANGGETFAVIDKSSK